MKNFTPTLLATLCSLALAGGAFAAEPDDPKAEPAESHHGGGDAMQYDKTAHPVEGHSPTADNVSREQMMHSCKIEPTGNADHDYALRLRHHHLVSVEMSRRALAATADADMRVMTQHIIDSRTADIAAIDKWLAAQGVNADKYLIGCGIHAGMVDAHAAHDFSALDANGDGYISHSELADTYPLHQHFEMVDTNGDGRLDRAEIDAHNAAMRAGTVTPRLTSAPHAPGAPGYAAFAALDANGDGFLVATELSTTDMLFKHFDVADTNKDGRLSPAEVDAHHQQMHSQMKH